MRVLLASFENPATFMGGVEVHTVELARALASEGADVSLATRLPDEGLESPPDWEFPVEWIDLPAPRASLPAYQHRRLMRPVFHRAVAKLASEFDLVHGQNAGGMGAIGVRPVVATVHTDVMTEFEAARLPLPRGIPQRILVAYDQWRWGRWLDEVDACITVGEQVARRLHDDHGTRCIVIPNGVPDSEGIDQDAAWDRLGLEPGPRIAYLGRLSAVKRVDRLVQALPMLPDDVGLIVGGSGAARSSLEELAAELNVTDRVRFLGFVPDADKAAVLAAGDAFVLPSENEGQPITLLEALQQGVPVVVSDLDWVPAELRPYAYEAPVAAGTEALAQAIQAAIQRGRVPDAPVPSWRDVARRTIEVYDEVL